MQPMRARTRRRRLPVSLLLILSLLGAMIASTAAVADDHIIHWDGSGAGSENCEDYNEGEIHWIFQAGSGHEVEDATVHVPGEDSEDMELRGQNNFSAITGFGDAEVEDGVISFPDDQPYVEIEGEAGRNARLIISGWCEQAPGSILFEKTYTTDPLEGEAAEFTVDGTVMTLTVIDDQNYYCADDLTVGQTYTITETDTPTGFETEEPFDLAARAGTCADRLADPDSQTTIDNVSGPVDVTVTKFKTGTDARLSGFDFALFEGHVADTDGSLPDGQTPSDTGTSDGLGEVGFDDLDVGDYTVCETGQPSAYWSEADPQCQEFTLTLADVEDGHELTFFNDPLSRIEVFFHDETGYTTASIECVDSEGNTVASAERSTYGAGTIGDGDNDAEADHLDLDDYVCTVSVQNGASAAAD